MNGKKHGYQARLGDLSLVFGRQQKRRLTIGLRGAVLLIAALAAAVSSALGSEPEPDGATAETAQRQAAPAGAPSPAKASADSMRGRVVPVKRSEAAVRSATSAPKAECARQAAPPAL